MGLGRCDYCGVYGGHKPSCKRRVKAKSALSDVVMPLPIDRDINELPDIGRNVLVIVQHWHTKGKRFAVLKAVDEDDHNWQTVDDGSELSHDWNVIAWDYLPELEKA
jgi:hypothetical protein